MSVLLVSIGAVVTKSYSMVFTGLTSTLVEVEVNGTRGQPSLVFIGLATKAVDEAKERITSAFACCGVEAKNMKTVVNLAPAEVKKTSSALELAIAVGLLNLYGFSLKTEHSLFLGELSLDGKVKSVRGLFSMVLAAKESGIKRVFFPQDNLGEVEVISGIDLIPLESLQQLIRGNWQIFQNQAGFNYSYKLVRSDGDFCSIIGQYQAKKAMAIAAAGNHNLIFIGSPGSGKSILAKTLSSILPPLSLSEAIEVTRIYSIKGFSHQGLVTKRPFREPHHSSSLVGILGGGKNLLPGEISLAHQGVLFLDEFLEYPRQVIESLRQPMETGEITITRAIGTVKYPAKFMLVVAANPCPCGLYYQDDNLCVCGEKERQRYQQKLSGPILDRIDLQVRVNSLTANKFLNISTDDKKLFFELKKKVVFARKKQINRQGTENHFLQLSDLKKFGQIDQLSWQLVTKLADKFRLSNRSLLKILRVARTIADLENSAQVSTQHISEAFSYRLN